LDILKRVFLWEKQQPAFVLLMWFEIKVVHKMCTLLAFRGKVRL
jgi:hypothetical protein